MLAEAIFCMASAIYHEARGEPVEGKIAVAQVIMHRVGHKDFPNDVCSVVKQKNGFSFYNGRWNYKHQEQEQWELSKRLAAGVIAGGYDDRVKCADHYARIDVSRKWMKGMIKTRVIGNHAFYRSSKSCN